MFPLSQRRDLITRRRWARWLLQHVNPLLIVDLLNLREDGTHLLFLNLLYKLMTPYIEPELPLPVARD